MRHCDFMSIIGMVCTLQKASKVVLESNGRTHHIMDKSASSEAFSQHFTVLFAEAGIESISSEAFMKVNLKTFLGNQTPPRMSRKLKMHSSISVHFTFDFFIAIAWQVCVLIGFTCQANLANCSYVNSQPLSFRSFLQRHTIRIRVLQHSYTQPAANWYLLHNLHHHSTEGCTTETASRRPLCHKNHTK